jgi:DNA-binding NtrC family response regulator
VADLLIVDDDSDLGDLLAEALLDQGHSVRIARHGEEGLRLVAEREPDLVLLDVEMPVLDGPDMAYQMFLRNCGAEKIPIVLVSGRVDLPRAAAVVGTPYFLAKPYDVAAVVAITGRALAERIPPMPSHPEARP